MPDDTGIDALKKYEEILRARLPEVATPEIAVPEFRHFTVSNPALAVAIAAQKIRGGASGYELSKQMAILDAVHAWHKKEQGPKDGSIALDF